MKSFDNTAKSTNLNIKVIYHMKSNNFTLTGDISNTFKSIKDTKKFAEIYESLKSEFEGYKSQNPTVQIKIEGKLLGEKIGKNFEDIDSFRSFLIENSLASSDTLDNIDKNVTPCLVM